MRHRELLDGRERWMKRRAKVDCGLLLRLGKGCWWSGVYIEIIHGVDNCGRSTVSSRLWN